MTLRSRHRGRDGFLCKWLAVGLALAFLLGHGLTGPPQANYGDLDTLGCTVMARLPITRSQNCLLSPVAPERRFRDEDRGRTRRSRSRAGFTLVEVIIVLSMVITFASIAAPQMKRSLSVARVEAASRRVALDLTLARKEAQRVNADRTVTFDADSETYTLGSVTRLIGGGGDYAVSLSAEPYHSTVVSADFAGGATVTFNLHGIPDNPGSVVVECGGLQRTVAVDSQGLANRI